ncbi:MAG: helix-turn-helix transcriptional regulator [Candidatus Paceibacterota bacterium]|jgi:transcriptional regulator with XRE-family HTH domain
MDIVKRLEIYRLENKIPQEALAEKLGVAFSTVNRWLNGKSKPNLIQSYHIEKLIAKPAGRKVHGHA